MDIFNESLIILILMASFGQAKTANKPRRNSETKLLDDLFTGYDTAVRPVRNTREAVHVSLKLNVNRLNGLDGKSQLFDLIAWFSMHWVDEFLTWEPTRYNDIEEITQPNSRTWKPDICLYNGADNVFDTITSQDFTSKLYSRGLIKYSVSGSFKTLCKMEMKYFPFDSQICKLQFGSWFHGDSSLKIVDGEIISENYEQHSEWNLESARQEFETKHFASGNFSFYNVYIHLSRKPSYIVVNVLVPCLLLSALFPLVFMLPAASGERVSLGVTILLAFSVFLLAVAENVPRTSRLPLLSIYLISAICMAGLSLFCTLLSLTAHHACADHPVPPYVRIIVFKVLGSIFRAHRSSDKIHNMENPQNKVGENNDGKLDQLNIIDLEEKTGVNKIIPSDVSTDYFLAVFSKLQESVKKLSQKVNDTTNSDVERKQPEYNEWREIAKILDKTFLALFTVNALVSCLIVGVVFPTMAYHSEPKYLN